MACNGHTNSCSSHSGYVSSRSITFTNDDVVAGEEIDAQDEISELLSELNTEANRRVNGGAATGIGISSSNIIKPNIEWVVGTGGSQGNFVNNGSASENRVVSGTGPFGYSEPVWECLPQSDNGPDGGWNNDAVAVSSGTRYVFGVYMWRSDTNGTGYLGCSTCENLDGSSNSNPYFWSGDLLQSNKWYLILGVLHASGTSTDIGLAGVYDVETGSKVVDGTEFRHTSGSTSNRHRVYHYYNTDGDGSTVYQKMVRPFVVPYSDFPGVSKLTKVSNITGMVADSISLTLDNPIEASELRAIRDLYLDLTIQAAASPITNTQILSGQPVLATTTETMKDGIVDDASTCVCDCNYACTCDCNYCTCDCNYCTCDCNYACTCDCNYACTCDCNYCTCDCNYCTCDCNYCTCNCNYCTCNCNYSCTCNCNYSDIRLKFDIIYF